MKHKNYIASYMVFMTIIILVLGLTACGGGGVNNSGQTAPDTTPPTVSSTSPANSAANVAVNTAITATFSEAMDASTVTTATFTLNNGVTGQVTYSGTTATFTPSGNLAYSTTYTATITTDVKDAAGNAMAGNYTWSFTTTETAGIIGQNYANITSTARYHTSANSDSLDLGDQSGENFTIEFWMYITSMPASGDLDTIITDDGYQVGFGSPPPANWGLQLTLYSANGSSKTVAKWYYYTAPPLNVWTHVVFQFEQSTEKLDVAINGIYQAGTPSSAMTLASGNEPFYVGGNPNYVSDADVFKGRLDCLRVSNTLRYNSSFTPPSAGVDSEYPVDGSTRGLWWFNSTAQPYGDQSGNGNTLTTGSASDATPPTVSSTNPANSATDVAVTTPITATFSETMDASTVTTATFTLNNGVTGTVTYSGTTATFTPSGNLAYSTTYTATITTGVKDSAGNTMASNYTWTFTTGTGTGTATAASGANFKMPDTGQATSYTTTFGEDSDYTINPPSYTDNANGTITDNITGLIWQMQDDGVVKTWADAITYCETLVLGGQTDWRLPSRIELISIVDYGVFNPSINTTYFPGTISSGYWSSTTSAGYTSDAWVVYFSVGGTGSYDKTDSNYARCVRGGQ